MLISLFSICQNVYPSKAIINNDTVGIISINQVRNINKTYVILDECREMQDSLKSQLKNYDKLTVALKSNITSQDKEIQIKHNIIIQQHNLIQNNDKIAKNMKRKIIWLKTERIALACGIAMLVIVHFVLIK